VLPLLLGLILSVPSQAPAAQDSTLRGARNPAFAADGRLAVALDGDLYVRRNATSTEWTRITSGPAWDREPAWSPDGEWLVFSSNRAGDFDLWRLRIGANGPSGEPERLTSTADPDGEPSVARDGRIVFVRGRGAQARLFVRVTDGKEQRLTKGETAEHSPAISPAGDRVAYISEGSSGRRLRIRILDATNADSVVVSDRSAEYPAWSPRGDRLLFTSGGARPGVFVTPLDGRYVNLVSARHAAAAWSPDGSRIILAELGDDPPGYNGDPDRLGDRDVSERFDARGRLYTVDAPSVPDERLTEQRVAAVRSRAERNAEAFDRVWTRTAQLYYATPAAAERKARWAALRDSLRPRVLAAPNDSVLQDVIYLMLRERPPLRESAMGRAAVSSAHPVATEAGLEILRKGGNVIDAAVAVSFALGVVEPDASGVGGYGQMVLSLKAMDRPTLLEFMTRVPEDASLTNASLLQDGRYPSDGPVLANVPGTVSGMHTAWKKYGSGKVPWADLIAPAIRAATDGFIVSDGLATTLATERDQFSKYDGSRALFFRNGQPLRAGDTLKNPDLAWTLQQIAKNGADGFYKGEVARRIVADLRGKGNAMRLTDLSRYFAAEREPVSGTYRGYTLYSSAPPVAGGAALVAQLNLLEQFATPRRYTDDPATLHAMIAAWQLVPTSRNRIADPGLWSVTTEPITNKDTARVRWRCFDPQKSLTPAMFRGDTLVCAFDPKAAPKAAAPAPDGGSRPDETIPNEPAHPGDCDPAEHAREVDVCRAAGTTAFTVADADGNVVAVTQTLGTWGGNFYVSPGLGFLYNDKLTSYGTDPTAYGARLPYARHGSTLAPTIVFHGAGAQRKPVFALGAAGNAWITSAVYQTLVGLLDDGLTPQQALELPRFLPSQRGAGAQREYAVEMEDGFAPSTIRRLQAMGYTLNFISLAGELRMGYAAAVAIGNGSVTAGADPRRSGAAGAVPK
jgi:gamma-glutamyltranspeptidase/glutathione hydrolase